MTCNCADLVDEKLAAVNTRLGYMFGVAPLGGSRARSITTVRVATEKLDAAKRGAARAVAAIFCPFCGTRIVPELPAGGLGHEKHTARIARHYDQHALFALTRVPIERGAISTNFPLWHV
jgi:hypothetical protein